MASYNKGKLIALLERKRAAYLTLRDYGDRARDARRILTQRANHLRDKANYSARESIEKMLSLSPDEALKLSQAQIEEYEDHSGRSSVTKMTGINFAEWQEYLAMRAKVDRLDGEHTRVQEGIDRQFSVLPSLLEAVKKWGFSDPEREVV